MNQSYDTTTPEGKSQVIKEVQPRMTMPPNTARYFLPRKLRNSMSLRRISDASTSATSRAGTKALAEQEIRHRVETAPAVRHCGLAS